MHASPLEIVERLRHEYFADTSQTHLDLSVRQQGDTVTLSGTVLDRPAADFLLGALHQRLPNVHWRDELSPLVAGPDYSWAIAQRAVLDVRREPSNHAERVTQILFGEPVEILREVNGWAFVRLRDGYLGWTQPDRLLICTPEAVNDWRTSFTHIVRQPLLACYTDRSGEPHQQVMLLPFGTRVQVDGSHGPYRRIRLPDGGARWVAATGLVAANELVHTGIEGLHTVVDWAHASIGTPYLWGGKTPFGYDCSGLVQVLFWMIGVDLRRDAHQQAGEGLAVEFDEIQFGDCLFMDTSATEIDLHGARDRLQVTHVVLALGDGEFLHAAGRDGVIRRSFDPQSPLYVRTARERFLGARRYV